MTRKCNDNRSSNFLSRCRQPFVGPTSGRTRTTLTTPPTLHGIDTCGYAGYDTYSTKLLSCRYHQLDGVSHLVVCTAYLQGEVYQGCAHSVGEACVHLQLDTCVCCALSERERSHRACTSHVDVRSRGSGISSRCYSLSVETSCTTR